MLFDTWSAAAESIGATTKRLEKLAVLVAYLPTLDDEALPIACRFFAALVFPRHDMRTTQVGGSIVHGALAAVSGADPEEMHERYVRIGDTGDLAGELLAGRAPSGITLAEVADWFAALSTATGTTARRGMVRAMLERLGAREARFLVKLLGGELRIGLKEAQVEEAVARIAEVPLAEVRRANLLRGDVGEVALLARRGELDRATLALFHPLGFMLAQPLATAEEIAAALEPPFVVEDKYDGIRAQAHISAGRVALYSRTLDEITRGYPEVAAAARALVEGGTGNREQGTAPADSGSPHAPPASLILDAELLAYDPAAPERALPFLSLQKRLGRKAPTAAVIAEVPVALVVYDLIAVDGALVIEEPWRERRARLERLAWAPPFVRLAPARMLTTAEEIETAFLEARAAGNEGIIAKDPGSAYTPGRRGKAWIKLKKAERTLDVVITGAERGHGRRRAVLSDYTFAVRASETDPTLLNVGKAYNGLTDAEIAELTPRLEALTVQRFGRFHQVTPEIVLEVTFDIVQPSSRHKAGYALRFPRIVRIRDDKPAAEIDTLERVREMASGVPAGANVDEPPEAAT